jgi:ABC-type uncharacterized transport system permease subunit
MNSPQSPDSTSNRVMARNNTVDAVVAAVLFMVGAVVVFEARKLGAEWTSDGPGAGYFPFYIGLILCISCLGILVQAVSPKSRDRDAFVDREQLGRVVSVLGPALVFVLAITFLGMYVASAIYIALFMVILGKYSPLRSILVGVLVNVAFFMMFEVWFKVPLFKGSLEPLRFLGY